MDHIPEPASRTAAPRWHWQALPAGVTAESVARKWLAAALGWPDPVSLPLQRDPRGRPRLRAPLDHWDCNWSHSGGGLLLALGAERQLGVDVEIERPRPRALAIAARYFAQAELVWLQSRDPHTRDRDFLRLWCAKEAVLKAHGHGLVFGLDRLAFAEQAGRLRLEACDPVLGAPADWTLDELVPAAGFVGAMAWRARAPVEPDDRRATSTMRR